MTDIQSQLEQLKTEDYQQDQTRLCTMMAFLIGVDWQKCSFYYEQDKALYEELNANKSCVIIRALCRIRTNLILHFSETENEIRYNLCNIDRQDRFREDVKTLHKNDVDIIKVNYHVNQYLADLNKLIAQRINDVKGIFPDWVRWDYIRPLFLMPKGQNEKEISSRSKEYLANKNCYPYQMYINWIPVDEGNILINDRKFVKVLYSQHGDVFTDMSKVKDASETVKKNIYEFIDDNETIQLVVDCENSDPFKLASVLKQLDKDSIQKIQKIVLYDDVHTTNAWRYLKAVTGIPVEHNVVERIKYDKSLVDIKIAIACTTPSTSARITLTPASTNAPILSIIACTASSRAETISGISAGKASATPLMLLVEPNILIAVNNCKIATVFYERMPVINHFYSDYARGILTSVESISPRYVCYSISQYVSDFCGRIVFIIVVNLNVNIEVKSDVRFHISRYHIAFCTANKIKSKCKVFFDLVLNII